ncbi:hypothetical protein; putative signal peptide [Frankia alni ACN14a]|uniref:Uncharacterized protein n=1 Tax=Frankia alni (strain DSM 45986 / CECT 9034 / ACN14a) TaxID=326424 RepID=Q0RRL6_FRAAA|nr:hypothetical protein; putative signal peptide [Frankia alni ACN14a]
MIGGDGSVHGTFRSAMTGAAALTGTAALGTRPAATAPPDAWWAAGPAAHQAERVINPSPASRSPGGGMYPIVEVGGACGRSRRDGDRGRSAAGGSSGVRPAPRGSRNSRRTYTDLSTSTAQRCRDS